MGLSVILVECDVTSPAGVTSTLRFSDRAIFPMAPDDADRPNAQWDDRLIEPPTLSRFLFADLQTLEPGLGAGVMTLANADRALDAYQGHVWGEVRVWRWMYGQPFSTARSLITGPAAGTPTFDVASQRPGRVRLSLHDYRLELERPLQSNSYAGNNNGTAVFFEGDASLKGKLKPLAFGRLMDAHIPAPAVNHSFKGYQLHDGPIRRVDVPGYAIQVFDRGGDAGIAAGGDDLSFFYGSDTGPFPGFNVGSNLWYALGDVGLIKFNSNPVGAITFGFLGDATGGVYVETAGPILARILARLGVPEARIGASVEGLSSTRPIGAYADTDITAREFTAWIARSVPAALLPDRQGVWQAIRIDPPAAVALIEIDADEVLSLEADESASPGAGAFAVGWDRIWTTYRRDNLQPSLLGTPAEARLAEAYRWVTTEDGAFKERFSATWRQLRLETALRVEGDAQALAADLKAMFGLRPDGRPRRSWRVTLEWTEARADVELGSTIGLRAPDFGVDDTFILIGEEPLRPRRDQVIWTLWG